MISHGDLNYQGHGDLKSDLQPSFHLKYQSICYTTQFKKKTCFYPSLQTASQFIVLTSSLKQVKQKKSKSQAQLHLPVLDLFCANLWVQHHLPLLHLAWTPPPLPPTPPSPFLLLLLLLCPLIMTMALYSAILRSSPGATRKDRRDRQPPPEQQC